MFEYRTQGFNGYAVKYSPFYDSRLAVAASANFGLVGNGRLYILGLTPNGIVAEKWYLVPFSTLTYLSLHTNENSPSRFDTQDALFDVSWSEAHENQVVVAAGDGSIKLFDIGLDNFPVQSWQEHKREVFAVSWNLVGKDTFCSSSWDGCIKIVRLYLPPPHPRAGRTKYHNVLTQDQRGHSGHHTARNRSSHCRRTRAPTRPHTRRTTHPS